MQLSLQTSVYQAVQAAVSPTGADSKYVDAKEMQAIEAAILEDNQVDPDEARLLEALKNNLQFSVTADGTAEAPYDVEAGLVRFPERVATPESMQRLAKAFPGFAAYKTGALAPNLQQFMEFLAQQPPGMPLLEGLKAFVEKQGGSQSDAERFDELAAAFMSPQPGVAVGNNGNNCVFASRVQAMKLMGMLPPDFKMQENPEDYSPEIKAFIKDHLGMDIKAFAATMSQTGYAQHDFPGKQTRQENGAAVNKLLKSLKSTAPRPGQPEQPREQRFLKTYQGREKALASLQAGKPVNVQVYLPGADLPHYMTLYKNPFSDEIRFLDPRGGGYQGVFAKVNASGEMVPQLPSDVQLGGPNAAEMYLLYQ